jgi:hypothetical protein
MLPGMRRNLPRTLKTLAAALALLATTAPVLMAPTPAVAQSGLRRGDRLPDEARGDVVYDYDRWRLRRPPNGYAWYRVGDYFVLASTSSGVIFDIVPVGG